MGMDLMGGANGFDMATFLNSALQNRGENGNGFFGGNDGFLMLFLLILFGGGNGFFGNNRNQEAGLAAHSAAESVDAAIARARADGLSDQVVVDAVKGNAMAIQQLATTLNCDINAIQGTINCLDKSILQVGNQVGMSTQQVINAVQSGNCDLAGKLANCCCELKTQTMQLSYDNRIQNMQQTETLTALINGSYNSLSQKIDNQNLAMKDGFQGIKDYLAKEKINTLEHTVTQLENNINNSNQTAILNAYVQSAINPIATQVQALMTRIPPQAVPAYPAPNYSFGYYNNNSCGCGNGCVTF